MFKPVDPKPNFRQLEEEILKFWENNKIFEKSLEKTTPSSSPPIRKANRGRKSGGDFVFYDGPPFATGLPHYGHILASTIKDLIPRYQTMKGRYVKRRWGWDCHGLPIEEIVERKLKISGKKDIEKLGIAKFNETCRSEVLRYAMEWGRMVRRIARWTEFDNSYKTMDRDYMESVWRAFKEIYRKGLIYEGRKVLLYCPRCETPISNFEVAMDNSYQDVTEEAVTVKFMVRGEMGVKGVRGPIYLLSWTTTPWTLPGNAALAVNPSIKYQVVRIKDENYIVAKDRVAEVFRPPDSGNLKVSATLTGKDLIGLEYEPLFEANGVKGVRGAHRIYPADFVTTEEGTGIVHTAVVYGEEDYELGQKYGLPVVPLLDEQGKFNEKAPKVLQGKYFKDAEGLIKDDLAKRGLLFKRENHTHSYPHCWRCENVLFYNAIPAWFINIQKIKKNILKSNKKDINWYPEHLKFGRYQKSVEQAPDWNISRNRYWGNPMPVWRCQKCGQDTVVGSVEELKKLSTSLPLRVPSPGLGRERERSNRGLIDLHRPYIDEVILKCEHCGGEARRITEIFDSWFEAASMPFASVHWPFTRNGNLKVSATSKDSVTEAFRPPSFPFPADFVAEYIAQTRAWFYVMHVMSLILFGKAPFRNVVTTGTILAEDGNKMSKSRRNFPDPWEMIEKYGVDALRFYLMTSVVMQADNLNFSERDLQNGYRKVVLILWNVFNYFRTYSSQAKQPAKTPATTTPPSSPPHEGGSGEGVLDQWILARLQELINNVTEHFDSYNTVQATREIEKFINDLSTWYLRRSRGREDGEFLLTLQFVLIELSKVIAPIMPYLSEVIYLNLRGEGSVHLSDWPEGKKLTKKQAELLRQMKAVRKIAEEAHALRAKAGIKLRQKLSALRITNQESRITEELLQILKDEVNVLEVVFGDKLELDTAITPELKLEGLARELERQIQELRKESGLKIGQVVDLAYETESDIIKRAMERVDRKKIYVAEVFRLPSGGLKASVTGEKVVEVEGERVKFRLAS